MVEYFSSPEFKAELKARQERTAKIIKELEESRKVTWQMLHEPFTI